MAATQHLAIDISDEGHHTGYFHAAVTFTSEGTALVSSHDRRGGSPVTYTRVPGASTWQNEDGGLIEIYARV